MKIRIKTTPELEKMGWTTTKVFFFVLLVATGITASLPAISSSKKTGAATLIPGLIRAVRSETLTVSFPARVKTVAGREGVMVKAGDLIAELESPELSFQFESAERRLHLAELRAAVSTRGDNSDYKREQLAAAEGIVEAVRRRIADWHLTDHETAYEQARRHAERVNVLFGRHLATEEEMQAARRAEQNELRNLKMAKSTLVSLEEDLKSALSQQKMARLSSRASDPETARIAQLELDQNRRDFDVLKARMNELLVVAPFDGILLSGLAQSGDMIPPGAPVARIADVSRLQVDAEIAGAIAKDLTPGTPVSVRLPLDPPRSVEGTVMGSALAADVRNGGYVLRIGIPISESSRTLVGMEATVEIPHDESKWRPRF